MSHLHRGVALGDLHCSNHNPWALEPLLKYISEREWESFAQLGDAVDLGDFSTHPPDSSDPTTFDEIEAAKDVFTSLQDAGRRKNESAKLLFTPGNHERRWWREIFANPKYHGLFPHLWDAMGVRGDNSVIAEPYAFGKVSSSIRLELQGDPDRAGPVKPVIRRLGEPTRRYGLCLTHGAWHNRNAARTHAERMFFGPTLHGHTHQLMEIAADSWQGDKVAAYSVGWLGLNRETWQTRPDAWRLGFCTYTWDGRRWHIALHQIHWDGHEAWFRADGQEYRSSRRRVASWCNS